MIVSVKFIDGADASVGKPVVVIYGPPGSGKTTFALTADKPCLFDFDGGAHRAANKAGKAIVPIKQWPDIGGLTQADVAPYETIIADTAGECLDCIGRDIIETDPSYGSGGALTLRGYGVLKSRFAQWLSLLRSYDKNVILIAHMNEEQKGDKMMERIVAQGASRNLIYQQADVMGRVLVGPKGRYVTFNPALTAYGKNPGIEDTIIPPPSEAPNLMGQIIKAAIEKMGTVPAGDPSNGLPDNVEDLNKLVAKLKADKAAPAEKKRVVEHGTKLGFKFDKGSAQFEAPADDSPF